MFEKYEKIDNEIKRKYIFGFSDIVDAVSFRRLFKGVLITNKNYITVYI